jgi:hypothetical protein
MLKGVLFFIVFCLWFCFGVERKYSEDRVPDPFHSMTTAKIGDNPFPTNPMNDLALQQITQGTVIHGVCGKRIITDLCSGHRMKRVRNPIF